MADLSKNLLLIEYFDNDSVKIGLYNLHSSSFTQITTWEEQKLTSTFLDIKQIIGLYQ